jgi:hypothetical protein
VKYLNIKVEGDLLHNLLKIFDLKICLNYLKKTFFFIQLLDHNFIVYTQKICTPFLSRNKIYVPNLSFWFTPFVHNFGKSIHKIFFFYPI